MKNILLLAACFFVFVAGDCDPDDMPEVEETGTIQIAFRAVYGSEPLVIGTGTYPYHSDSDQTIRIGRYDLFTSDINLSGGESERIELSEIDFFDFNISDAPTAEAGLKRTYVQVPVGEYTALSLSVGVPSDDNDRFCTDCSDTSPLSRESHWWPGWGSYIFQKLEGQVDTNGDGVTDDLAFSYHTGTNNAYRSINLPVSVAVRENETTELTVLVDVQELFRRGDDYLDISTDTGTHSDSDAANAMIEAVMNRYNAAFSIE